MAIQEDEQNFCTIIEAEYRKAVETQSDINKHLQFIRELASSVSSVTEFGVRQGNSTRAFLAADVQLRAYDLELDGEVQKLFDLARAAGRDCDYRQGDTQHIDIEETDLLFIDTLHTYSQLSMELKRHAGKVRRYIAFHDTDTFGVIDENSPNPQAFFTWPTYLKGKKSRKREERERAHGRARGGLLPAVLHHLADHASEWRVKSHHTHNNGLTVLERIATS